MLAHTNAMSMCIPEYPSPIVSGYLPCMFVNTVCDCVQDHGSVRWMIHGAVLRKSRWSHCCCMFWVWFYFTCENARYKIKNESSNVLCDGLYIVLYVLIAADIKLQLYFLFSKWPYYFLKFPISFIYCWFMETEVLKLKYHQAQMAPYFYIWP